MHGAPKDVNFELMLDGNSAGGLLQEIFSQEMTAAPAACAACGSVWDMGQLLLFGREMGAVLRCPGCSGVMLRIVKTPRAVYIDGRGVAYVALSSAAP